MLIAKFFKALQNWKTLHVFLLEILAVFVGITASLFIDDWRQQRQDHEILEHLLQATHYNAVQDQSYITQSIGAANTVLQDAVTLVYGDVDALPDAELIRAFAMAAVDFRFPEIQPGYQRLLNTSLSIPFDHTMAELDYSFRQMQLELETIAVLEGRVLDLRREIRAAAGLPDDSRNFSMDFVDDAADRQAVVVGILSDSRGYRENIDDAAAIRVALREPAVQSALRDVIGLRERSATAIIRYAGFNDQVIESIRRFDPEIPVPVGTVEISGSATSVGWSGGLSMRPDASEPNTWRLRVVLTDGVVKFRADHSFASNWGAPDLPENRASNVGFEFGGDPAAVFPHGVGEFGGLNIPVEAGTYDVTFNSQTLEYSFDRVAPQDPE